MKKSNRELSGETVTVWITKWCLTNGIEEFLLPSENVSAIHVYLTRGIGTTLRIGRDVFLSKEDAVAHAEKMRLRKIAAHEKAIKKLSNPIKIVLRRSEL